MRPPPTRGSTASRSPSPAAPSAAGTTSVTVNPRPSPYITAPLSALPGTTGLTASVVLHAGDSYLWGITNGTITAGGTTNQITFTAGSVRRHRPFRRGDDDRHGLRLSARSRQRLHQHRARRSRRGCSRLWGDDFKRQQRPRARRDSPRQSLLEEHHRCTVRPHRDGFGLHGSCRGNVFPPRLLCRVRDHRPRRHGRRALLPPLRLQPGHPPRHPLGRHLPRDVEQRSREDLDAPRRKQLPRRARLRRRLPLRRDPPPQRHHRRLRRRQFLPGQQRHPLADGRLPRHVAPRTRRAGSGVRHRPLGRLL